MERAQKQHPRGSTVRKGPGSDGAVHDAPLQNARFVKSGLDQRHQSMGKVT